MINHPMFPDEKKRFCLFPALHCLPRWFLCQIRSDLKESSCSKCRIIANTYCKTEWNNSRANVYSQTLFAPVVPPATFLLSPMFCCHLLNQTSTQTKNETSAPFLLLIRLLKTLQVRPRLIGYQTPSSCWHCSYPQPLNTCKSWAWKWILAVISDGYYCHLDGSALNALIHFLLRSVLKGLSLLFEMMYDQRGDDMT